MMMSDVTPSGTTGLLIRRDMSSMTCLICQVFLCTAPARFWTGERVRHQRRSRLGAARGCGHAPFQTRDLASGLEDLGPRHAPARGKVGLEDVCRLGTSNRDSGHN